MTKEKNSSEAFISNKYLDDYLKKLESLLQYSPSVLYTCTQGGIFEFTYINESVKELLGYDNDYFIKDDTFFINNIHPEDKDRAIKEIKSSKNKNSLLQNFRFKHKKGHYNLLKIK